MGQYAIYNNKISFIIGLKFIEYILEFYIFNFDMFIATFGL